MPPASTPPPPTPTPPTPPSSDVTDRLPLVPARVEAPAPRIVAGQELRFFHAYNGSLGGDDLYRIYVTDYDLLVFQLGPGSVSHGQFVPRTKVRSYRGGGMIGAVAMWRESQRLSRAARVRDMLEMADEEMLRQYAGRGTAATSSAPMTWTRFASIRRRSGAASSGRSRKAC